MPVLFRLQSLYLPCSSTPGQAQDKGCRGGPWYAGQEGQRRQDKKPEGWLRWESMGILKKSGHRSQPAHGEAFPA